MHDLESNCATVYKTCERTAISVELSSNSNLRKPPYLLGLLSRRILVVVEHVVFQLGWVTSKRDCWTATRQGKLARAESEQQCNTHFEEILVCEILIS